MDKKEYARQYYEKHKEELKARSRLWTQNNPERKKQQNDSLKDYKKDWAKVHVDEHNEQSRSYYQRNKEAHNRRVMANYYRNRPYYSSRSALKAIKLKLQLCQLLGGIKCSQCDVRDIRALNFDHINNNGSKDRTRTGARLYAYYIAHPEEAKRELQVLCANHNWIKEMTRRKKERLSKS